MNSIGTVRSPSRPAALLGTVALGVRFAEHWALKITDKEKWEWKRKSVGFPVAYILSDSKGIDILFPTTPIFTPIFEKKTLSDKTRRKIKSAKKPIK